LKIPINTHPTISININLNTFDFTKLSLTYTEIILFENSD